MKYLVYLEKESKKKKRNKDYDFLKIPKYKNTTYDKIYYFMAILYIILK